MSPPVTSDPKANLLRLLDEPQRFREWLAKQPLGRVVGLRRTLERCPAAKWLFDEIKCPVAVSTHVLFKPWAEPGQVAPEWLVTFINKVDLGSTGSGVRVSTCLRILDEVLGDD